jgi:hypothetical protein
MSKESMIKTFREAYIDLHVAHLALLRLRNQRKMALPLVVAKDMERKDPFAMAHPASEEAVKKWLDLWKKLDGGNVETQTMEAVSEAIGNHWKSWTALMDLCPPDFRKFKIELPYDSYKLTATTLSRETLAQRAKVLTEAWKHQIKGDFQSPS